MRRVALFLPLALVLPVAAVALPVAAAAKPTPHAVPAHLYHVPVAMRNVPAFVAPKTRGPLAITSQVNTQGFRAVGVSWKHDPGLTQLTAEVRVRTGGQWGSWQVVNNSDDTPGANGGSTTDLAASKGALRDGTDPLWIGHADAVQGQILNYLGAQPQDVRIDLIDPGSSAADAAVAGTPPASSALADTGQPQILTRADWGADESIRLNACPSGPDYGSSVNAAFVHHTVTGNGYSAADVPAIIRSIYAYHVQGEGWCDVGYNFLVDTYGRIWEGRYGGIDKAVIGAQAGGFNTDTMGVSMIGTYTTLTPPQALTDALVRLLAWKLSISYDNPMGQTTLTAAAYSGSRYPTGAQVPVNVIAGHRDVDLTDCPGNAGYSVLPFVRTAVFNTMVAGFVKPNVAVTPRSLSGNGSVHLAAGVLQPGSWQLLVQDASGNAVRTIGGSGSSVDATWDMTNSGGQPAPPGKYTLTLSGSQAGVSARAWTTTVTVGNSFGALDGVSAPNTGSIEARGWAVHGVDDAPATVRLTVSGSTVGRFAADLSRPDVAAAHPGYSADHGFDRTVSASSGYHTVCAYAVDDPTGGPDAYLGCIGVTVPGAPPTLTGPAANPVGYLDAVQAGPAEVRTIGWTLDPETSAPIDFAVYVDSTFEGYHLASATRQDVAAAHPGYGSDHGFDQIIGGIVPGSHRVCVYAMNVGNGTTNPTLGCATVSVPTGNPTGNVDAATPVPGGFVTWGWALDPDTSASIPVHLYIDGHLNRVLTANQSRPDVGSAFPLYGSAHGFAAAVTVASGRHSVCAYAMNVAGGSANIEVGCKTVTVLAGNPIGNLDAVVPVPGGVILWGWAIDPDTAAADQAVVSVDGATVATLTANQGRPDVGHAYPTYGSAHGFATVLKLSGGTHRVCVTAQNVLAGTANTTVGCRTVTVLAGNPFGHLDVATASGGKLSLWGWAIDPDVVSAIPVHIYIDGKLTVILNAANPRPDVASAYPSYGPNHGFSAQLPITAGSHQVCAYAINTAAGSANPNLGCITAKS